MTDCDMCETPNAIFPIVAGNHRALEIMGAKEGSNVMDLNSITVPISYAELQKEWYFWW